MDSLLEIDSFSFRNIDELNMKRFGYQISIKDKWTLPDYFEHFIPS